MTFHQLNMLEHKCAKGCSWFKIGMVTKCGWAFRAELSVPDQAQTDSIKLRLHIVHHTPRIQCFSSNDERLHGGGIALQFSLPDGPVPSCGHYQHTLSPNNMVWLADVKARRYTMPSKDKFVVSVGAMSLLTNESRDDHSSTHKLRQQGDGLILTNFDSFLIESSAVKGDDGSIDQEWNESISARLPLSQHGSPLCLAAHPSGEWLVVGYGMNGRGESTKLIELVSMRKRSGR